MPSLDESEGAETKKHTQARRQRRSFVSEGRLQQGQADRHFPILSREKVWSETAWRKERRASNETTRTEAAREQVLLRTEVFHGGASYFAFFARARNKKKRCVPWLVSQVGLSLVDLHAHARQASKGLPPSVNMLKKMIAKEENHQKRGAARLKALALGRRAERQIEPPYTGVGDRVTSFFSDSLGRLQGAENRTSSREEREGKERDQSCQELSEAD